MQTNALITVLTGQTVDLGVSISAIDLIGRSIFWLAAPGTDTDTLTLHKDVAESEIDVPTADRLIVHLMPEDTADQSERGWYHELWVIDEGESVPLLVGEISLEEALFGPSGAAAAPVPDGVVEVAPVIELNGRFERKTRLRGDLHMADRQSVSLLAGQALDIEVKVTGVDLSPAGRQLWWVMAPAEGGTPILRFSTADRIAVTGRDTCLIRLHGVDTQRHGGQVYRHELWLVDYDRSPVPLMRGQIRIKPSLLAILRASSVTIDADVLLTGFQVSADLANSPEDVVIDADVTLGPLIVEAAVEAMPPAVTIDADIQLAGFQVEADAAVLPPGNSIDADFSFSNFTVSADIAIAIAAQSITPTAVSIYSYQTGDIATFTASGGSPNSYTWSLDGLDAAQFSINAATGVLSVPTALAPGTYSFTVIADNGKPATVTVTVTVAAASVATAITGSTPAVTADGYDVRIQLAAEGAVPGVTGWSLSAGAPVSIDNSGLILVPGDIAIGAHTFDVNATNPAGTYTEPGATLTIDQWAPVASLDPTTLPAIETAFTGTVATLTAFGQYPDDVVFSLTSPPAGFGISGRNLTADGTQAAGTPTLQIRARNGFTDGVADFDVTFSRPITVTAPPAGDEFVDTFDGRAGQNLNTNTAWTQISGPADAAYTNSAGELVFNGSTSNSATYLAPNLGHLSHGVEITGVYSTGQGTWSYLAQACFRYENGAVVAWAGIRHIIESGVYYLRLDVWNGALTTVAAYNVGRALDNDTLRIEKKQLAGSVEISIYLNGTLVIGPWTSTDPKLQNNTRAGLSSRGPNARIGNYRHYEIGAAGTSFVSDAVLHSYLMDEGSGQYVLDSGGASNDSILGTTTGADVNDPAWTATGLNFNTDDLIASEVAHPATAEFHIDLVAKWDTSQNLAWRQAYNHWAGQDSTSAIQIFTDASGIIRAAFSSSGGNINLVHSKPTGAHQHIQAWRDASNVYLAVDGAIVSGVPIGTAGTSSGTIYHGAKYSGANHMLGTSEVSISHRHSRALTAAERAQNREHVIAVMAARGVTLVDEVREPVATLDFNMSDRVFSQVPNLALVQGTESGRVVANQGELYGTGGGYLHSTTALGAAQYVQAKIISVNAPSGTTGYMQPLWARATADGAHGVVGRYYNGKYQIVKRINNAHTTVAEVAKAFVANGILRLEVRDMMSGSTWAGVEARLFLDDEMLMPPVTLTEAVFQTALRAGIRGYDGGFFDDWEAGNIVDAPAETVVSLTAVSESNQVGTVTAVKMEQRLWPSNPTPATVTVDDPAGVELGIKFQASVSGRILGIRFYKGIENTGTHVGNLWNASGTNLGTVNFADETASGWQEMNFASPIPISANTTYVASYYAPVGKYSSNSAYFTTALTSADLTALSSADAGGNGVYSYATSSAFPSSYFNDTNYWVDVIFEPDIA